MLIENATLICHTGVANPRGSSCDVVIMVERLSEI